MKKRNPGIVTLITDFGDKGEYSGAMKGAILKVNPHCQVVDITHQIEPQNILQASFVLKHSYPYYPPGAIHLVVIDPGVGTKRKAVVVEKEGFLFVGPDNGVFSCLFSRGERVSGNEIIQVKFFLPLVSDTFHGRDIFAPVAGHLSLGLDPKRLGPGIKNLVFVDWPAPVMLKKRLKARILWADSFGNLMTNIPREPYGRIWEGRRVQIKGKGWCIHRIHRTYGQSGPGRPIALFGSGGLLEISVNQGNALNTLGLKPGDPVTIVWQ